MNPYFWLAIVCMCVSAYVAFAKQFRPMTWFTFYFNIGAVAINGFAAAYHFYNWVAA